MGPILTEGYGTYSNWRLWDLFTLKAMGPIQTEGYGTYSHWRLWWPIQTHFMVSVMLIIECTSVTLKCRQAKVMLDSLSCSFTSIYFLTNLNFSDILKYILWSFGIWHIKVFTVNLVDSEFLIVNTDWKFRQIIFFLKT